MHSSIHAATAATWCAQRIPATRKALSAIITVGPIDWTVWSEDPPARVSRLVTNIEVEHTKRPEELAVFSNVAIYRYRRQDEEICFNGKRRERFRMVDGQWKLCRRHILVNHHVFLDENISLFF